MQITVMVVFHDDNYDPDVAIPTQRSVTRSLNSCLTSENPYTTIGETNKQTKDYTGRQGKRDDTSQGT